jgi:hypothetical protein
VNGRPYTQAFAEDEVELFDVKLKEEVTELQQRVDEMTAKVCALRRGIPPEAKRLAEETVLWEAEAYARKMENVSRKEEVLPGKGQTGLAEMSLEEIQKEYTASMGKIKDIMMVWSLWKMIAGRHDPHSFIIYIGSPCDRGPLGTGPRPRTNLHGARECTRGPGRRAAPGTSPA